jgi:hypothetical protein
MVFFAYEHLPPDLQRASKPFCELAHEVAMQTVGDNATMVGAEATVCLRKLLEARDCAVRAVREVVSGTSDLSGNMTATLLRYPGDGTEVSATETVSISHITGTNSHEITYTPENAQTYWLKMEESSTFSEYFWEDQVEDTPTAAVADNAYCTEADVVAWAQFASDFTASTIPTENQVLLFMETRAAELYSVLTVVMGSSAVGPSGSSGYSTEIDTSSDVGFALGRVLRRANAIGAAADALEAAGSNEQPNRTERVIELEQMYLGMLQSEADSSIRALALQYIGLSGQFAFSHLTAGDITNPTITSREREELRFDQTTKW